MKSKLNHIAIFVLFFGYKENKFYKIKAAINKICENLFYDFTIDFYIIENNSKKFAAIKHKNSNILLGDNSCFDFSGWDAALKQLRNKRKLNKYNFICFANDTFLNRNYTSGLFLDNFNKNKLPKIDKFSAVGFLDDFPKTTYVNNLPCKVWIRSNLFFLSKEIIKKIKFLTFPVKDKYLFNNSTTNFFKNKKLSKNWIAYMSSWLFNLVDQNYPEYKLNWIKSRKLTKKNIVYFKKKAKTIMSEHYLTSRIVIDKKFKICNTNLKKLKKNRHVAPYYQEQIK